MSFLSFFRSRDKILLILLSFPLGLPILCALFSLFNYQRGLSFFLDEDRLLENLSVLVWLVLLLVFLLFAYKLKKKGRQVACFYLGLSLAAFFVAMEEISWGQRIFKIKTPQFFVKNNYQNEIGLHNTKIAGVSVNKLISGKVVPVFLLFYFLVVPFLKFKKNNKVLEIINLFQVPFLTWKYTIIPVLYLVFSYTLVSYSRKGELAEFYLPYLFAVLFIDRYLAVSRFYKLKIKTEEM